jgi:hypothetical protein
MLTHTGSLANIVPERMGGTFLISTFSRGLAPKNAQVGEKWLHLLSYGPNGR